MPSNTEQNKYDAGLDKIDLMNYNAATKYLESDTGAQDRSSQAVQSATDNIHGQLAIGSLRYNSDVIQHKDEDNKKEKLGQKDTVQHKPNSTLILSDFPDHIFLGLDASAFNKGKSSIVGVKGLPAGAHLLYGSTRPEISRSAVWFICGGKDGAQVGEVLVRKWNTYDEIIMEASKAEIHSKIRDMAGKEDALLPYSADKGKAITGLGGASELSSPLYKIWHHMTFAVNGEVLTRITEDEWNTWKVSTNDGALFPDMGYGSHHIKSKHLSFVLKRGDRTFKFDIIGKDRTQQALDSSAYVLSLMDETDKTGDSLVGELQFAYLTGMLVGNVMCLEQWATMVKVLFKAYELSLQEPVFFTKVIQTIHAQMTYDKKVLDGSIFDHDAALKSDLKLALTKYKSQLNEKLMEAAKLPKVLSPEQIALGKAFDDFETYLYEWNWEIRGEYVRSGRIQLEDGTFTDVNLSELAAEDERASAPVKKGISQRLRAVFSSLK